MTFGLEWDKAQRGRRAKLGGEKGGSGRCLPLVLNQQNRNFTRKGGEPPPTAPQIAGRAKKSMLGLSRLPASQEVEALEKAGRTAKGVWQGFEGSGWTGGQNEMGGKRWTYTAWQPIKAVSRWLQVKKFRGSGEPLRGKGGVGND